MVTSPIEGSWISGCHNPEMLSKTRSPNTILDRLLLEWVHIEWPVDPFPQIAICKEVPVKKRY
jgi:hypothetical protein